MSFYSYRSIISINELSQGYLWVIMTENTSNNLKYIYYIGFPSKNTKSAKSSFRGAIWRIICSIWRIEVDWFFAPQDQMWDDCSASDEKIHSFFSKYCQTLWTK